jgi:hypothetical protein
VATRDETLDYNHRDVLPNEVVIDLDAPTEEENFSTLKKLVLRLTTLGYKYSVWSTGGKGYHIHTHWNIGNAAEQKFLREKIHAHLVEGVPGTYDTQLLGRHLVRLEYGLYEKAYPKERRKKPTLNVESHFAINEVPECVWREYREEVLKLVLKHLSPRKDVPQYGSIRPCMKHILSPEFKNYKDGSKRAMFIVASYYRNLEDLALYALLSAFNRYNLREPYTRRQLEAVVKSVRAHKGRPVGCRFRHELLLSLGAKKCVDECEAGRS